MSAAMLVIGFDSVGGAGVARQLLRDAQAEGRLTVDDAAVVVRVGDAPAQVTHELDRVIKSGVTRGGLIGLAVASLFAPVAGLVIGAVAGAVVGASKGLSIDHAITDGVAATIAPDSSALIVGVAPQERANVLASTAQLGGILLN